MADLDPMAQLDIEAEIRRLSRELTDQTTAHARTAREEAEATAAYKLANARAMLDLRGKRGTVPEKEAQVLAACAERYEAMLLAHAVHEAVKERGRNLRAQLDALRTLAANVREAVTFAQGRGG